MNVKKVNELLNQIESAANQIEAQDSSMSNYTGHIRKFVSEMRVECVRHAIVITCSTPS